MANHLLIIQLAKKRHCKEKYKRMAIKNKLAILAINLLLLQVTFAKPTEDHFRAFDLCKLKDTYSALAPSDKDNTLKPTVQLMKIMMFDLQDLALSYVRKGKSISDQILKESVLKSNTSPEMKKFKDDLEDFEKKYTNCHDMEELFDLVEVYSNATVDYYELDTKGSLNTEGKVILDILKKYNVKEIDDEFEKKFVETFIENFGKKINELKDKLKTEEGGMGNKVLKWFENVKTLKTTEEKMEAFKEYMKLYGFEE